MNDTQRDAATGHSPRKEEEYDVPSDFTSTVSPQRLLSRHRLARSAALKVSGPPAAAAEESFLQLSDDEEMEDEDMEGDAFDEETKEGTEEEEEETKAADEWGLSRSTRSSTAAPPPPQDASPPPAFEAIPASPGSGRVKRGMSRSSSVSSIGSTDSNRSAPRTPKSRGKVSTGMSPASAASRRSGGSIRRSSSRRSENSTPSPRHSTAVPKVSGIPTYRAGSMTRKVGNKSSLESQIVGAASKRTRTPRASSMKMLGDATNTN